MSTFFWDLSMPCTSIFWVYLCPTDQFLGSILALWGVCPTDQNLRYMHALQINLLACNVDFLGLTMPRDQFFWVCLCHVGHFLGFMSYWSMFWGTSMLYRSVFGVYLCSIDQFLDLSIALQVSFFGVYLCPTGRFLGSIYALLVSFWGLPMSYGSIFGVYL